MPWGISVRLGLLLHSMAWRSGLWAPSLLLDGVGQVIMVPLPGTRKIAPGSTSDPHALPYRELPNSGFTSESRDGGSKRRVRPTLESTGSLLATESPTWC